MDKILEGQGYPFHLVFAGVFDEGFLKRYKINSPALSIGLRIGIPVGGILILRKFVEQLPRTWLEFVVAHELAHIYFNHFPLNVGAIELWRGLPDELRDLWIWFKIIVYLFSLASGEWRRFPGEEFTAKSELLADEWAAKVTGNKEAAIKFLEWMKEHGIVVTYFSPTGGFPALTIDERIKHLKSL